MGSDIFLPNAMFSTVVFPVSPSVYTAWFLLALFCSSCMPEDTAVAPYDRGMLRSHTIALEPNYQRQVYMDLESNRTVGHSLITDWDIAFTSADTGFAIALNTARFMAVADMGAVEFSSVQSAGKPQWRYDAPTGNADSTAIGTWWEQRAGAVVSLQHVYIIDLGVDALGKKLGYKKMMLVGATPTAYTLRFAALDGSNEHTATVERSASHKCVGFSFSTASAVLNEKPMAQWDIVFTRYTHVFYEPDFKPYSVTGVLLNNGVAVAVDSVRQFEDMTARDTASYALSSARDAIGYGWKTYSLDEGKFTVHQYITYIIRDRKGFYYKLRFIDFYDNNGNKGFPTFDYQTL